MERMLNLMFVRLTWLDRVAGTLGGIEAPNCCQS
jgi:hypothetical protein